MNVDDIKDWLADNPKAKKWGMITIGVVAAYVLIESFSTDTAEETRKQIQLASQESRSFLGVTDDLNAYDQKQAQDIVETMGMQMDEKQRDFELRDKMRDSEIKELEKEQQELVSQMYEMQQTLEAVLRNGGVNSRNRADTVPGRGNAYQVQGDETIYEGIPPGQGQGQQLQRRQTEIITAASKTDGNVIRTITQRSVREVEKSGKVSIKDIEVERLSERSQEVEDSRASASVGSRTGGRQDPNSGQFTLTMGSIIGGTLINGVAAPTKVGSQENPVPVLLRVKRNAIMPNSYTLDIRECMILGEAIGDLGSERAMIRANAISCITESGKAIEQNINAYAVSSSDGLTGIRGTLIERSGKAIANSMAAGFLSGFADAASPRQVNALDTSPTATSAWQSANLDQYAGAGMMKGAGNAMSKVAEYYTAIAEAMWPVIEVPAGIEVDFIVQKGMTLQLGDTQEQAQAAPTQQVNSNDSK
ncbi:hypothetical protein C9975_04795 [Thalassospira xiamenensis]|nr:hypothetical protein C9975_04795 [Thalassospira xiamenensis]